MKSSGIIIRNLKYINMNRNPWLWIPTLYFAEGIPYFIVNNISVVMFKNMGMPNGMLALYTSLLYLPWGNWFLCTFMDKGC